MKRGSAVAPLDRRALIAVDLGAESCRVSLLRWRGSCPEISVVHRFGNAPKEAEGHLWWDLARIETGLDEGLRRCAAIAQEGIRSIAVDGWAVDYVELGRDGRPLRNPFCYRDERTVEAERSLHRLCAPERLRTLTGVQLLRINTLYQLHADRLLRLPQGEQWLNLPEYVLYRWGGARVAEMTNASHTQMMELSRPQWCEEIFRATQLDLGAAPRIVPPGTQIGVLSGGLATLPTLRGAVLIAPACHDTASAIAGIPAEGDDWAYISSGTWSLVGTVLDEPRNDAGVAEENFTNLRAVGNRICFHKNVNGMWLIRQCMEEWAAAGQPWNVAELAAAAATVEQPAGLLEVDNDELTRSGGMLERINAQRRRNGYATLDEGSANAPAFASLIFHGLAARYAEVLKRVELHSGKRLKRVFVVGGGSRNVLLNGLTAAATGLEVECGAAESSTLGNFAVQLATLEDEVADIGTQDVFAWALLLNNTAAI